MLVFKWYYCITKVLFWSSDKTKYLYSFTFEKKGNYLLQFQVYKSSWFKYFCDLKIFFDVKIVLFYLNRKLLFSVNTENLFS